MRLARFGWCLVAGLLPVAGWSASLAVMPFATGADRDSAWMSKAVPDLLSRQFSQISSLVVLEREQLQSFLKELDQTQAPLFDSTQALRVGRIARVDHVVYGRMERRGANLVLSAFLMNLSDQRVLSSAEVTGSQSDILALVRSLAEQLLRKQGKELTPQDVARMNIPVTDSMPALEHFYRGLDHYDHGRLPDAWGDMLGAMLQDERYADASLWLGKLYEAMGQSAHAVQTYRDTALRFPDRTESLDAALLSARLLDESLAKPDQALTLLSTLVTAAPDTPQALEASYRIGRIQEKKSQWRAAYAAYTFIDKQRSRADLKPFADARTVSRFFTWDHAWLLVLDAWTRSVPLYARLLDEADPDPLLARPRGVVTLNAADATFREDRFLQTPAVRTEASTIPGWNEKFYVAVAPRGQMIAGIDLEVTGHLKVQRTDRDYMIRVFGFPMPRQLMNQWLGVIYGQTAQRRTLRKRIPFHGDLRKIVTLQLVEHDSEINSWAIRLKLQPQRNATQPRSDALVGKGPFYEGQPVARIPLPEDHFSGTTQSSVKAFYGRSRPLALAENWVVAVQGDLEGEATDLLAAQRQPDGQWSPLAPMPINTAADEYDPQLIRGEDGLIRLFWLSNKRGRGWELWFATFEQNAWSSARRVPVERKDENAYLEYAAMQDRRGRWIVAARSAGSSVTALLVTRDFETWTSLAQIPGAALDGMALSQDATERYHLIGASGYFTSVDGKNWVRQHTLRTMTSGSRMQWVQPRGQPMSLLTTDKGTGLQYSRTSPSGALQPWDLVRRADLEPFAATVSGAGDVWVALRQDDVIQIQRYRRFQEDAREERSSNPDWPIYAERETDSEGNVWTRYFARQRFRVPDVTSLAIEPDGRIWWGIETGIMSLKGDQFSAMDVSQGFPANEIKLIHPVPGHPGVVDVEEPSGRMWRGNFSQGWQPSLRTPSAAPFQGQHVIDPRGGHWQIFPNGHPVKGLRYFDGKTEKIFNPPHDILDKPSSIAMDKDGQIWIGTWFKGLYRLKLSDKGQL